MAMAMGGCEEKSGAPVAERRDPAPTAVEKSTDVEPQAEDDAESTDSADDPSKSDSAASELNPDDTAEAEPPAEDARPCERPPRRPRNTWVIFREAFERSDDSTCEAAWMGRNQFEIKTQNVKRMTVDMTRLPAGAPGRGPWILQVDGQGIELTGFKPGPGYTGHRRDLIRSKNGQWTVDKEVRYRGR